MCRLNHSSLSRWTPRYLTAGLELISWLWIRIGIVFLGLFSRILSIEFWPCLLSYSTFGAKGGGRKSASGVFLLHAVCPCWLRLTYGIVDKEVSPDFGSGIVVIFYEIIGKIHDPWETPATVFLVLRRWNEYVPLERNYCTSMNIDGDTFSWSNLWSSPSCHTLSNVFSKSRNTTATLPSQFVV
ncbi:unnamed protein product [Macrosiphum euphorbiae]|uniref:Uncharacterized protein n=1 Tax=Macrosiphum euphorbiae TaxID=13131 RepID=A0AAV0WFN8_9HEMI|nr:unnamed protein product [Macrosiphum euphorbiae]